MKNKNMWKKFSVWEWFAMIATIVLTIAVVCTAIIIANKKQALDDLKKKNEEITETESNQISKNNILNLYLEKIEK